MVEKDVEQRYPAIETMGDIGPAAKQALPALQKLRAIGSEGQQLLVVWAIARINQDDKEGLDRLLKALKSPSKKLRQLAGSLLGRLASQEPMAVQAIEQALGEWPEDDRIELSLSLARIRAFEAKIRPILEKAADNPSDRVRFRASYALERMVLP